MPVPQQNEQLLRSVLPKWLFWKTFIVSISMSLVTKSYRWKNNIFFFHLSNKLRSNFILNQRWTSEVLFLKVFDGRWPIINLDTLIHEHLYLISLETVVGFRKIRDSRNPVQYKCVLKKPDITYSSRNS